MTEPVHVFELRDVYVFALEGDRDALPVAVRSQYNADRDRFELPTADLLEDLRAALDEVRVVADREPFTVAFPDDPPGDVLEAAVHVEWDRQETRVLLPDPGSVERAVEAGGDRLADR